MAQRFDAGRLIEVIEQGRGAGEALVAHQLLDVEAAIALAKDAVAFVRDLSQKVVNRHGYRFPRSACSRSIDSNSALKLPFPNPRLPSRWISSKKSVGRSSTGWVKIC